jgi:hypothetical protein
VLEAARAFAQPGIVPEVTVRFVLWHAEETGLEGAKAYVRDRLAEQGQEEPPGSGLFPEPRWLGVVQHDRFFSTMDFRRGLNNHRQPISTWSTNGSPRGATSREPWPKLCKRRRSESRQSTRRRWATT